MTDDRLSWEDRVDPRPRRPPRLRFYVYSSPSGMHWVMDRWGDLGSYVAKNQDPERAKETCEWLNQNHSGASDPAAGSRSCRRRGSDSAQPGRVGDF